MGYPSEWHGGVGSEGGVATFKVEGNTFLLRFDCFADYQMVVDMLGMAFVRGKHFAANAMRSHVHSAIEKAVRDHAL